MRAGGLLLAAFAAACRAGSSEIAPAPAEEHRRAAPEVAFTPDELRRVLALSPLPPPPPDPTSATAAVPAKASATPDTTRAVTPVRRTRTPNAVTRTGEELAMSAAMPGATVCSP